MWHFSEIYSLGDLEGAVGFVRQSAIELVSCSFTFLLPFFSPQPFFSVLVSIVRTEEAILRSVPNSGLGPTFGNCLLMSGEDWVMKLSLSISFPSGVVRCMFIYLIIASLSH